MSSDEKLGSEKRLILFTVVTFLSILAIQYAMDLAGLTPPPPPPAAKKPAPGVVQGKPGAGTDKAGGPSGLEIPADPFVETDKPGRGKAGKLAPAEPAVALVKPDELILGSTKKPVPGGGFLLEVRLEQKGAGVSSVASAVFEAEFLDRKAPRRPLQILKYDPLSPPSLSMSLVLPRAREVDPADVAAAGVLEPGGGELPLDGVVWEVVRDDRGRVVRPVSRQAPAPAPAAKGATRSVEGQSVVFRTRADGLGLVVTKTYRLYKDENGFELDLTFESPEKTSSVVYQLLGPHGIPIEGEWYTGTFREAVFGQAKGSGVEVKTLTANEIAKRGRENPERFQFPQPLRFTGIENQYFAALLEPNPAPKSADDRWDEEAFPYIFHMDPDALQKADIGVKVKSRPVQVGPNLAKTHTYKVFAGPKSGEALAPYDAEILATYRKGGWFSIPLAPTLATSIITPLLRSTHEVTRVVAAAFGGKTGNYGVAIILLTMLVRLAMFPLTRKQALMAKKMQDLQPYVKEIQEKYKDDKERQAKEVWAFNSRQGVNPLKGCLPALIQLPIFVGLWQALNNSVQLRHASFLYIQDLSAPDMLFRFPTTVPFLGDYFNLLPFLVVTLMLVQTKLFAPPATTPEAEAQQKMMKYMMVFMAFMFYKVPSGLGLYFITSSLWQISERLLLPKISHTPITTAAGEAGDGKNPPGGGNNGGGGRGGNNGPPAPAKPPGKLGQFFAKVLEEAQKNPTYRNLADEKDRDRPERPDRDRRDRGKPRAKPGRRR